jgi:hypothetical protein
VKKVFTLLAVIYLAGASYGWSLFGSPDTLKADSVVTAPVGSFQRTDCDTIAASVGDFDTLYGDVFTNGNDSSYVAYCSLYDATTYRERVECYFLVQSELVSISFPTIIGTLSGGAAYIRSAGNIPAGKSLGSGDVPEISVKIVNNSSRELGCLEVKDGYIQLKTLSSFYLTAGPGGLWLCEIVYRKE